MGDANVEKAIQEINSSAVGENSLAKIGFVDLSPNVALYKVKANVTEIERTSDDPDLVIVCSWAFAQPRHIVKYLRPYQQLYPFTDILLVQNVIANAIWVPDTFQTPFFAPAAEAAREYASKRNESRFHLHAFSNGGSHAAVQLSESYQYFFGAKLPVASLVLDSCPGQPRIQPTVDAMVQGVPTKNPIVRSLAAGASYLMTATTVLLDILQISMPAAWKLYLRLNDVNDVFLVKKTYGQSSVTPVPRSYIFSRTDTMIMAEDVIGHAAVARQKLGALVDVQKPEDTIRLEEFAGTPHVNHVKTEAIRYWQIVQDTWLRAMPPAPLS